MKENFPDLNHYVSIMDRLMKMYYDHGLSDFKIGWGQQFYVEYIYDHPGTSAQEMVEYIRVDKATLTKVVKKLAQIGYIKVTEDEKDRRIKHLYLTELAIPAAKRIKEIQNSFYETLCMDIPPEDVQLAEKTMKHMVENINRKIWHRMEET